jgi:hypothetical protein
MLYKLEFNTLLEYNNTNTKSSSILIDIYSILENSLLLHKYKIRNTNIKKYQVNNYKNINFNLIKEDSIVILHLDIYKNDIESIRKTIDWCLDNNKDLFIPLQKYNNKYSDVKKVDTRFEISEIIREYEGESYTMEDDLKQLKRDLIIKSL